MTIADVLHQPIESFVVDKPLPLLGDKITPIPTSDGQFQDEEHYHEEPTLYYNDPEVARLVNELKENPGRRILFDASRDLTIDDINFVIDMIDRLKAKK